MMKSLKIPSVFLVTLAVNVLSCTPSNPNSDASTDRPTPVEDSTSNDVANVDVSSIDVGSNDANCDRDVGEFNPRPVCARLADGGFERFERCGELPCNDTCQAGCMRCLELPFGQGIGLKCRRMPGSVANCPEAVCSEGECPMGCQTCTSPLFCIVGVIPDSGIRPICDNPSSVCDPTACAPGCRAVG